MVLLSFASPSLSGGLSHNIHFWLGAETSQDEAGIAAYKTVELDEGLGGGPVQYREVQGNESATFVALFKNRGGLEYLPGGVESGFRKVDRDAYVTRLLMVDLIYSLMLIASGERKACCSCSRSSTF